MKPPYEITTRILSLYGLITEALGICQSILLVKPEAKLRKQNRIKTIYSSLAFEFVPIEKLIKENQEEYYRVLEKADSTGSSTIFIEFMLDVINKSLRETISESTPTTSDYSKRIDYALSQLKDWFDRKDYLSICKGISTATASRDIKQLLQDGLVESKGSGRMMKYRKK